MACESCMVLKINTRLKLVRVMLGMKQVSFIKLLGVCAVTYTKMENGDLVLKTKHKNALLEVGISVLYIEHGIGCPFTIPIDKVTRLINERT